MAKAVRWRIPFVSTIDKISYRIDIYDETGSWSGITVLDGGPSPFVTNEDDNDDVYSPIRIQTGTIQVCTAMPSGGILKLEDILPDNNTSRPVRLIDNEDDSIMWQGFLSCEAYNQDYIGTPQILSLPVNSVLEAMASVECDPTKLYGVQRVYNIIGYALKEMGDLLGDGLGLVYISGAGREILYKFVNTAIFYSTKVRNDEGYTQEYVVGITLKALMEKIATYMGWCVREYYDSIFMQTIGGEYNMIRTNVNQLNEIQPAFNQFSLVSTSKIEDLIWRGTGHQKSVTQGARNVEVVANLQQFDIKLSIPDGLPQGGYITGTASFQDPSASVDDGDPIPTALPYISTERNFSNIYELNIWNATEDNNERPVWIEEGTIQDLINASTLNPIAYTNSYCGAAPVRFLSDDKETIDINGLYVKSNEMAGYQTILDESIYIMKIRSINQLNAYNGNLILNINALLLYNGRLTRIENNSNVPIVIKWGNLFLQDDYSWSSTYHYVRFTYLDSDNGKIIIPINSYNYGEVVMYIPPVDMDTQNPSYRSVTQWVYTALSLQYESPEDLFEDRKANTYYQPLNTTYRNEVSIGVDMASTLNNLPNPSIILNVDPDSHYNPLETMTFYQGVKRVERPEIHLLNNMASYYRKSRTSLSLQVAPPNFLPAMSQLIGINDQKGYIAVLSEQNWLAERCTLKCLEIPIWLIVAKSTNNLWVENEDYIRLFGATDRQTIYMSSPVKVDWSDRNMTLQSMDINGSNGYGSIEAGENIAVRFNVEDEVNEEGWIDFSQNGEKILSIHVIIEY
jgi:hypothetical protein